MNNFPASGSFTNVDFQFGTTGLKPAKGDTDVNRRMVAEKFTHISVRPGTAGLLKGESGGVKYSEYYELESFQKGTGIATFRPSQ
ncbi:MAG: hypothetical protein KTR22_10580 [Flavobacteriaceae bacterium]|nr:hypothetical protein [Flavobacteriaceae bacterium]